MTTYSPALSDCSFFEPTNPISHQDFENGLRLLSQDEIDEVSGAWVLNALGGIAGAAAGAIGAYTAGGDVTDILIAAGAGGTAGLLNPLQSFAQAGGLMLVTGTGAHVAVDLQQVFNQWYGGGC